MAGQLQEGLFLKEDPGTETGAGKLRQGLTVLLLGPLGLPQEPVMPRIQTAPLSLTSQPARRGEAGPRVAKLQAELRELGYFPMAETPPYFGMSTDAAVRNFQREWGLIPDGVVGPTTQSAIDEGLRRTRAIVKRQTLTYKVQKGDSLLRISHALLGDAKRWKDILDFNHLTDPNRIVPGMVLKIPSA